MRKEIIVLIVFLSTGIGGLLWFALRNPIVGEWEFTELVKPDGITEIDFEEIVKKKYSPLFEGSKYHFKRSEYAIVLNDNGNEKIETGTWTLEHDENTDKKLISKQRDDNGKKGIIRLISIENDYIILDFGGGIIIKAKKK